MIRFQNVSMAYPDGTVALRDVSLEIKDGEFVFLVGASGAGKTTLTKLLMCEERVSSGILEVNQFHLEKMRSWRIPKLRRTMGVVFQDFRLFENKTVYENVAFPMRVIGEPERKIKKAVPYFLDQVGLGDKASSFPNHLSGGEQQRVAFARALVNNPVLIIADEPTGSIDNELRDELMDMLLKVNRIGKTVLVVTHDTELLYRYRKRTVQLYKGALVSDQYGFEGYVTPGDGGEFR